MTVYVRCWLWMSDIYYVYSVYNVLTVYLRYLQYKYWTVLVGKLLYVYMGQIFQDHDFAKNWSLFFNFKHQLLHIFYWNGQNQDIPYDQLEEESHNIWSNLAIVSYMSVNLSVYFLYSGAHKDNFVGPRIQKNRQTDWQTYS